MKAKRFLLGLLLLGARPPSVLLRADDSLAASGMLEKPLVRRSSATPPRCFSALPLSLRPRRARDGHYSDGLPAPLQAIAGGRNPVVSNPRWEPARRLTHDPGASRLTYNFARSLAADEAGRVHAVWYDDRGGVSQIYYKRSGDGGSTWGPDTTLSEEREAAEHPSIATSGPVVYVVWHVQSAAGFDIRLRRSLDGGLNWEPVKAMSDQHGSAHASVAASAEDVHIVWGDQRDDGHAEVYMRTSRDFGATWGPEARVSDFPFDSWVPTLAVSGKNVAVAWVDLRDGNEEEYFQLSTDGGATWGPNTRLTSDAADSWAPSLVWQGETLHFVWFDRRDAGLSHRQVEEQLDAIMARLGLPPEPAPAPSLFIYYLPPFHDRLARKLQKIQAAAPAWIAAGGDAKTLGTELAEYERLFRNWSTGWEIYSNRSEDGGRTWGPDTRLTNASDVSARPSAAVWGKDLHIVWFDSRDGEGSEVYYKRSSDGGKTWSEDERVTEAPGDSAHPVVAAGRGVVHVLWHDLRDGNPEIYYLRGQRRRPGDPRLVSFAESGRD